MKMRKPLWFRMNLNKKKKEMKENERPIYISGKPDKK